MKRVGLMMIALASILPLAAAQGGDIEGGISRRFAEILGNVRVNENKSVGLADLAAEVEIAMIDIDPDKVADLNTELEDLEREERMLLGQLEDLGRGLPVVLGPAEFTNPDISDISESALNLAKTELNGQEAEIARLERLDREKDKRQASERAARRKTPLSTALLATLEEIPRIENADAALVEEAKSEFPFRIARALFLSGDYRGALRQFRQVPLEDMTFQGRYEMLRCLEETEQIDEASQLLQGFITDTEGVDAFWNERAKSLKKLIDGTANLRQLENSDITRMKK